MPQMKSLAGVAANNRPFVRAFSPGASTPEIALEPDLTIEEAGWELYRLILDVASGRVKPWSDRWGLYNALTLFNPAPVT